MINPQALKSLVENYPDLVRANRSVRYPNLRVLKYKNKVFYNNLWNKHPLLVECRGLVVDDDYNVMVKPFTKVFNYGENDTRIDRDELCTIVRKVNGFMGCLTKWKGQAIVSTTGSLDSDFAKLAGKWVSKYNVDMPENASAIFEIVDPEDPHIIEEEMGDHLIGCYWNERRTTEWDLDRYYCHGLGSHRPEHIDSIRFLDAVKLVKTVKHEGFMVYGQTSGTVLKLKSPYYLTTKLFARMKAENLERALKSNSQFNIDEDYLPVVEHLRKNVDDFLSLDEQGKVRYVREFIESEVLNA